MINAIVVQAKNVANPEEQSNDSKRQQEYKSKMYMPNREKHGQWEQSCVYHSIPCGGMEVLLSIIGKKEMLSTPTSKADSFHAIQLQ